MSKVATKKNVNKVAKKESTPRGPSIRLRVFQLLAKTPSGLSGKTIMEKLELAGVPALLKDEGMCDKPRIRREQHEDSRGVLYSLTALGKKDLAAGKVDENRAPSAAGKEW